MILFLMIRQPPRSPRPDTLFPYTTRVLSRAKPGLHTTGVCRGARRPEGVACDECRARGSASTAGRAVRRPGRRTRPEGPAVDGPRARRAGRRDRPVHTDAGQAGPLRADPERQRRRDEPDGATAGVSRPDDHRTGGARANPTDTH